MWKLFCLAILAGLAACASTGPSKSTSEPSDWSAYRAQVLEERNRGQVSPVEAQERIKTRYEDIYGIDPNMEGAFAYGLKLYEAADAGDLSINEADKLAQERIDDALAHRDSSATLYVFPPEASD